jgi:phytoene dehydrogenase-like protein
MRINKFKKGDQVDRKKFRKNDYDVVVIGGGLSGLSAAAFLSKKGFAVALFERNNQLGGFVNSFKRGEYVFEASTHQISLDDISCESIK